MKFWNVPNTQYQGYFRSRFMSHQVIIFSYWCITFLGLGWQKLQGGLRGAGLGKTEHQVMRYLSSDNVNDRKRDEVRTKASPAGKLSNSWSLGTGSSVAAGCPWLSQKLITADKCINRQHLNLFPTEAGEKIPMSCSYSPSNLCCEAQMCSQQSSCCDRISVLAPAHLPSGACGGSPQNPCPTTADSPFGPSGLCRMSAWCLSLCNVKLPGLPSPVVQMGRSTSSSPWGICFYPSRYKAWFIVHTPKVMELWLHKKAYRQPFLVFNKYICSPKTLLTLEQIAHLSCYSFQ